MESEESRIDSITRSLPDPESARRFYSELVSRNPLIESKLTTREGLLSDLLTLSSFSPLLAATLLQNPEYIWWLEKRRSDTRPRSTEELKESLSAFSMNEDSDVEVTLSRFKRREFLRVFLLDIKRLVTISETTDEISHLADSILEFALSESFNRITRRYGKPLHDDGTGRLRHSGFTVVSLGKLGSRELNYSSDIDLLFLYHADGETSGGESGRITNKEFFIKVAETVVKLVGTSTGEGSAYRVDMRLRPHGKVGPLSISLKDAIRYYREEARPWERQMLIRARASAGDDVLFKEFMAAVSDSIYPLDQIPNDALRNVRLSKELIDKEQINTRGFNVKLGKGGIREIEFIAQALQLAHGNNDKWIRSPHTIKALSRLRDRDHISDEELILLKNSYEFLRRLEHILQMEHGLQTHTIPDDDDKQSLVARRMGLGNRSRLLSETARHTADVSLVFRRIFGDRAEEELSSPVEESEEHGLHPVGDEESRVSGTSIASRSLLKILRETLGGRMSGTDSLLIESLTRKAPHFAERLIAMPWMFQPDSSGVRATLSSDDGLRDWMNRAIVGDSDHASRTSSLRRAWTVAHFQIVSAEVLGEISHYESKRLQTILAEVSMECALTISASEVFNTNPLDSRHPLAILGLGKLGGRGIDYGSDLDLVLIQDESIANGIQDLSRPETFARISELFINVLSSVTRDGQMYRVDLRLRPDGKNGPMSCSADSIIDYFENRAAIWEWLAYLKVRCAGGSTSMGEGTEHRLRTIILDRAASESVGNLAAETTRIRERLSAERLRDMDSGTVDIKYGKGGLLDIYFASRFLQLVNGVDEVDADRSTARTLENLKAVRADLLDDLETHLSGYEVFSRIDHSLRLSQGRSTRLSLSNSQLSDSIRHNFPDFPLVDIRRELPEMMRAIRSSFERMLSVR
jgi:glutamate-ammonia-ligase adenylyltransferase